MTAPPASTRLPDGNLSFSEFAAQPDDQLDLYVGALLLARDARPGVNWRAIDDQLTALAAPLCHLAPARLSDQAEGLALELGQRFGLRGNAADYYDPDNSFIDQVLLRRVGIPISLSLVYIEVARRAGMQAAGVGFPGHFLVRLDAPGDHLMLDPFAAGRTLDTYELEQRMSQAGWPRGVLDLGLLDPSPVRLILARMLTNLRSVYLKRAQLPRLLLILDRMVSLLPNSKEALRDRGVLNAELGAPEAARSDLNEYLRRWPNAEDTGAVRGVLERVGPATSRSLN